MFLSLTKSAFVEKSRYFQARTNSFQLIRISIFWISKFKFDCRIRLSWSNSTSNLVEFDFLRPFIGQNVFFLVKHIILNQIRLSNLLEFDCRIYSNSNLETKIRPWIGNSNSTFSVEFRIYLSRIRNSSELSYFPFNILLCKEEKTTLTPEEIPIESSTAFELRLSLSFWYSFVIGKLHFPHIWPNQNHKKWTVL